MEDPVRVRTQPRNTHKASEVGATLRRVSVAAAARLLSRLTDSPSRRNAGGCALIEDDEECAGLELRHESDPTTCVAEWGGCNHCGVHIADGPLA